jgi:predicted membrane-bound spermidine synthase
MASRLEKQKIENAAGNLYGIDLAGAASGTLLVSLVCFPVMGLLNTSLLIAGIILTGILVMAIFGKKYS